MPPRTALAESAPSFSGGTLVFVGSSTALSLSAADDLALAGDGGGSGVASSFLSVDGAPFSVKSGSFTLVAEGTHTVRYFSMDAAGNSETPHSSSLAVDLTAPAVQFYSSGTAYALSAADPVSHGVASGVSAVRYLVDLLEAVRDVDHPHALSF